MALTHTIQALDGAGPEGTTLYVLYGPTGRVVATAEWPQPLERLAEEARYFNTWVTLPALSGLPGVEVADD